MGASRDLLGPADEGALLLAAQHGDERAFGRLLDRHRCKLGLYCALMLGASFPADEAMSEIVLIAWHERMLVPAEIAPRTWLYQIAARVCAEAIGEPPMRFGGEDRLTW